MRRSPWRRSGGIVKTGQAGTARASEVAILTSAFTAFGTMTTAYFGIKSMSNTAQSLSGGSGNNSGPGDTANTGGAAK
jgi:hypothetical protein